MSQLNMRLTITAILAVSFSSVRGDEETLRQRLFELDASRQGADTNFDEVERRGNELLAQYPRPGDRARIYFQIAHVMAQSDIRRMSQKVAKYARLALEIERDHVQRGVLYSYLGSAELVDASQPDFGQQRKRAAKVWLHGYQELLPLDLPAIAPELGIINRLSVETTDPRLREANQKVQDAQIKLREESVRIRQLIEHREIFLRQLKEVYQREPLATEELKQLAKQVLKTPEAVEALLSKVIPIEMNLSR